MAIKNYNFISAFGCRLVPTLSPFQNGIRKKKKGIQIKLSTKTKQKNRNRGISERFSFMEIHVQSKATEASTRTLLRKQATEKTRVKIKYNVAFYLLARNLHEKAETKRNFSCAFKSRSVIKTTADRKMSAKEKRGPFPLGNHMRYCRQRWKKAKKKNSNIREHDISHHERRQLKGRKRNVCALEALR